MPGNCFRKFVPRIAALAAVAGVALGGTAQGQQVQSKPVVQRSWAGFATPLDPYWSGETKRVNWTPPSNPGYGGGSGGVIISVVNPTYNPPKPIELYSSARDVSADSSATAFGVTAASGHAYDTSGGGWWTPEIARYGEIVNLQDVLLDRATSVGTQNSTIEDSSIVASGRVQAGSIVENSLGNNASTRSWGKSNLEAVYEAHVPMWFELSGTLAGRGSASFDLSLVNEATGAELYSLERTANANGAAWDFSVSGALPAGKYEINLAASASSLVSGAARNFGGSGEFSLTFTAADHRLGDVNSDGAVDAADLRSWKSGLGYSARGDVDFDGDNDGSDFLAWQRGDFNLITLFANQGLDTTNLAPWKASFGAKRGGDVDGDGDADGSDFLMWQRKAFGGATAAAVAEPSTTGLGLLAWAVASGVRRRALPCGGPAGRG